MNVLRTTKWAEFSEVSVNKLDMLARTFLKMSCFSKIILQISPGGFWLFLLY